MSGVLLNMLAARTAFFYATCNYNDCSTDKLLYTEHPENTLKYFNDDFKSEKIAYFWGENYYFLNKFW